MTTLPAGIIQQSHSDGRITYDLGTAFDPTPMNVGAYQVGNSSIREHGWFQRWTDRTNCPLTVKRTPSQIVASSRSFPFGNSGVPINPLDTTPAFAGPMDNASIVKYMPTGGGGSDRGLVTDYAAHFMRTGDPAMMFAQALAADSIPINGTDAGLPVDLVAHPLANSYGGPTFAYKPGIVSGVYDTNGAPIPADGWTPSTDHFPALTYIAFQASHDLGLLFNLQTAAVFHFTSEPYESGQIGIAVIGAGQTRQFAWGLRDLFAAHVCTMDAEAAGLDMTGLLPSSYFKKLLDDNLAYRLPVMTNPKEQTFRLIGPHLHDIAPWQCDYLLASLSFGVLIGHTDWTPLYLWALGNAIFRTDNKSGWPPAWCAAYKLDTVIGWTGSDVGDEALPRITWAQCFDNQIIQNEVKMPQAQHDAILTTPLQLAAGTDGVALAGCYLTLTLADYLDKNGLAGVRAMYPDFDNCLVNVTGLMKSFGKIGERFSVVPAAQIVVNPQPLPAPIPEPFPAPAPTPSPAPSPQPPKKEPPTMSDPLDSLNAAIAVIKADASAIVAAGAAEVKAAHDRIVAILAAATGSGTQVNAAELQTAVDGLAAVHTSLTAAAAALTTDTAALPGATV